MHVPTQKRMFQKWAFFEPSQLPLQHLVTKDDHISNCTIIHNRFNPFHRIFCHQIDSLGTAQSFGKSSKQWRLIDEVIWGGLLNHIEPHFLFLNPDPLTSGKEFGAGELGIQNDGDAKKAGNENDDFFKSKTHPILDAHFPYSLTRPPHFFLPCPVKIRILDMEDSNTLSKRFALP